MTTVLVKDRVRRHSQDQGCSHKIADNMSVRLGGASICFCAAEALKRIHCTGSKDQVGARRQNYLCWEQPFMVVARMSGLLFSR
jgi:hypothetical protein